jgi:uncharacterized membrane protein YeaQ/YmgE (transglycosylase-associated protein family)
MEILSWVLFGFVVGLVARALMPGRDSMGFVGTTVLGIFGALLGGWFARIMEWGSPTGFGGLFSATVGAIVVLMAVGAYDRRRRRRRPALSEAARPREESGRGGKAA